MLFVYLNTVPEVPDVHPEYVNTHLYYLLVIATAIKIQILKDYDIFHEILFHGRSLIPKHSNVRNVGVKKNE